MTKTHRAAAYVECAAAGMTQAETARALGVDASSVAAYSRRHGLYLRRGDDPSSRSDRARILRMASVTPRPVRIDGDLAYIDLTQGYTAVIDAADAPSVSGYNWFVKIHAGLTYAVRGQGRDENGKQRSPISLHRTIMGFPSGMCIDHKNGDGLDNRRSNLRAVTHQQNSFNRGAQANNKSGYKGVYLDQKSGRWVAKIKLDGVNYNLGTFASPGLAHLAYKAACEKLHGEFGRAI